VRILTEREAQDLLAGEPLDTFVARLSGRLQLVDDTYSAPLRSGVQIVLSKFFADLLFKGSPVWLHVTGWGIATEHLDLFAGYRRSIGETRPLIEAPVHLFEQADEDAFISLLCLVFFFSWDASAFDTAGRLLVQTSHDGWFEIRARDDSFTNMVSAGLGRYAVSLLARPRR
jgi:hypothetical protein